MPESVGRARFDVQFQFRVRCFLSAHKVKVRMTLRIPHMLDISVEVAPRNAKGDVRRQVVCYNCLETGHYSFECGRWKTRLCWYWQDSVCGPSHRCPFAHGTSEMRNLGKTSQNWRRR